MSDNDGMLPEDARVSEQDVDESAIEREFRDEYGELEQMFDKAEGAMASVSLLRIALRNEKAAPELLEYQQEVVEEVKHALAKQEEVIATIRGSARGRALQHMVLQMDFDRVRYLLLEYLRVRLRKIQSVGLYLITTQELHSRMSQAELSFCRAFVDLDAEHMQRLFLDRVPKSFRKYTEKEMGKCLLLFYVPFPRLFCPSKQ